MSLKEKVYVKCRFGRELRGKLVVRNEDALEELCVGLRWALEPDAERRGGKDHDYGCGPFDQAGDYKGKAGVAL